MATCPSGVTELELYLYDRDAVVGGISLLRGAGHPSFSAAERALLAKVRPYVEYNFGIERRIDAAARDVGGLTPREADVVRLVCGGASNVGIARELGIGLPTVKTHLEHVYDKLGVRTRAQLVARLAAPALPDRRPAVTLPRAPRSQPRTVLRPNGASRLPNTS